MKTEKKLITYSFVAIMIGVASVMPLAIFMSSAKAQTTETTPWFNVEVPYAAWTVAISEDTTDLISYGSSHSIATNFTVNPNAVNKLENARTEYYQLQVHSDLGQIEDITVYFGANANGQSDTNPTSSLHFELEGWFDIVPQNSGGGGGTFVTKFNGTLANVVNNGLGVCGTSGGSSSGAFANTTLPEKFLNAYNAQKIYIDVRRLGYVTFDGNSTIVTLASNEIIQHIELTKNGNQFTYGTVPENLFLPNRPVIPGQNP